MEEINEFLKDTNNLIRANAVISFLGPADKNAHVNAVTYIIHAKPMTQQMIDKMFDQIEEIEANETEEAAADEAKKIVEMYKN